MGIWACGWAQAQTIEVSRKRKAIRTTGDVCAILLPALDLTAVVIQRDWQGLKQGVYSGLGTIAVSCALKYSINKERPDRSNHRSFPSMHSSISYASATFVQRRYGWQWGLPAYLTATFVGWSRVYGKKHDWWDVAAGAAIGSGCSLIFTRKFAQKHDLKMSPVAGNSHYGIYAFMRF